MNPSKYNRRKFLGAVSATTAGTVLLNTIAPFSIANAQTNSLLHNQGPSNEYLLAPGLTYMNTGTLGPCRRDTMEESKKMWEELESLPVKFYGKFGAESLAEKTRSTAAGFFGCDLN
jgi:cysteine desulfurase/selenocysteine lyase